MIIHDFLLIYGITFNLLEITGKGMDWNKRWKEFKLYTRVNTKSQIKELENRIDRVDSLYNKAKENIIKIKKKVEINI